MKEGRGAAKRNRGQGLIKAKQERPSQLMGRIFAKEIIRGQEREELARLGPGKDIHANTFHFFSSIEKDIKKYEIL